MITHRDVQLECVDEACSRLCPVQELEVAVPDLYGADVRRCYMQPGASCTKWLDLIQAGPSATAPTTREGSWLPSRSSNERLSEE
jgi:hypothetical protein